MKNKIAFLTIVSGFILSVGCGFAFAGSATFDKLNDSGVKLNFDGSGSYNTPLPLPPPVANDTIFSSDAATPSTAAITPSSPPAVSTDTAKDGLLTKMGKDLKDKKMDYAVAGGVAALTGYLLMGTLMGGLLGFGIIVVFLLLLRNV